MSEDVGHMSHVSSEGREGLRVLEATWQDARVDAVGKVSIFSVWFNEPVYINGSISLADTIGFIKQHPRHKQALYGIISLRCPNFTIHSSPPPTDPLPQTRVKKRDIGGGHSDMSYGGNREFLLPLAGLGDERHPWLIGLEERIFPEIRYTNYNRLSYALLAKSGACYDNCRLYFPGITERIWRHYPSVLSTSEGYTFEKQEVALSESKQKEVIIHHPPDSNTLEKHSSNSIFSRLLQTGSGMVASGGPPLMGLVGANVAQRVTPQVAAIARNYINNDLLGKIVTEEVGPHKEFMGALPSSFKSNAFLETLQSLSASNLQDENKDEPPEVGKLTTQIVQVVLRLVSGNVVRDLTQYWTQEIGSRVQDFLAPAITEYSRIEAGDLLEGGIVRALNRTLRTAISTKILSEESVKRISIKVKECVHGVTSRALTHSLSHSLFLSLSKIPRKKSENSEGFQEDSRNSPLHEDPDMYVTDKK
ncbi:hypothetical protein AAMO2058_000598800 [Amorphochlora amoebiformis]